MLDEEMDHMIRQAAENHHPSYNDKAWEKMEMQLDKHLPQKKDRKKMIFFLLFFLLLGGGLFFTVNRFMGNKVQVAEKDPGKKGQEQSAAGISSNEPPTEKNATLIPENGNAVDQISATRPGDDQSSNSQSAGNKTTVNTPNDNKTVTMLNDQQKKNIDNRDNDNLSRNKRFTKTSKGKVKINIADAKPFEELEVAGDVSTTKKKSITGKTTDKLNVMVTAADPVEDTEDKSIAPNSAVAKNETDTKTETKAKTEPEKEIAKDKKDEKEKEPPVAKSTDNPQGPAEKKREKKFTSNFALTFSVGPDASFVSLNRFGKINLTYGAGLSYNFAKRLTVRTGFYSTKKIYTATADQYHTPGGNYPHLVNVDANCKVYEIPLSVAYSFGQRKNHNWFGNIGLSSFIMKTEDYTYNYKNYNQAYSYNQKVSNENKHYFSVLTVSGGYNYQFNKRVSIQAEPYLQLP